jgi:hypothetical protein
MANTRANRSNLLAVKLLDLRRHLMRCADCRGALKGRDYDSLCEVTKSAIVEVAMKWDANIADRLAAHNGDGEYVFPCPDPNAHGPAYALTAQPCIVTDMQGRLV